jgi:hypothetical protein
VATHLHQEFEAEVRETKPWGLLVELENGQEGYVDNTKAPGWQAGAPPPGVGTRLHVVVLDDEQSPWRLSTLQDDVDIARRKRAGS